MRSNHKNGNPEHVRVELKYCEHCGGLWVREGGAGVYCERCQPKVADLPGPKKRPRKTMLPVGRRTLTDDYELKIPGSLVLEVAGGVA